MINITLVDKINFYILIFYNTNKKSLNKFLVSGQNYLNKIKNYRFH